MKRTAVLFSVFLLGLTAFAQQGGMSRADLSADEMAIKEVSKNWLSLDRSNDINGIMELFDDNAVVYRRNQEPAIGKEAIRQSYLSDKQMNPNLVSDWKTEKVDVSSSGDMAIEYGTFTITNSGPDGQGTDKGNYVTVFRKIDGKWKIVADIGTSSKPAEKQM
jgi:uncharacterized protein (TIGR02246 family)